MVPDTQKLTLPDFEQPQKSTIASQTLAVIYCLEHFMDIILGYKISVDRPHRNSESVQTQEFKRTFSTLVRDTTES